VDSCLYDAPTRKNQGVGRGYTWVKSYRKEAKMSLVVEGFRGEWEWDAFVDKSYNGTIFHKQRFLSYHPRSRFEDASLSFKHKGRLVSVFPAANVEGHLISHPGSSFGGPVFRYSGVSLVIKVVEEIISYAKGLGFDSIQMRLPPNIIKEYPIEAVEFVLFYKGFRIDFIELSTCVPLGKIKPAYNHLQAAHKAEKQGVYVRECDDYETFWPILNSNLKKHNAEPTHTLEEILRLKKLFPKEIRLFAAFIGEQMLSGAVLFINNSVSFETFYLAQDYSYTELRSLNLLIFKVIQWAMYQELKFLNFGISTEKQGRVLNPGLVKFKEGYGGCNIVRKTYSLKI
jgi:hypothetical protein